MRIILDAMGGDNAPDAVIKGAVKAAGEIEPARVAHVLIDRIRSGCKGWL